MTKTSFTNLPASEQDKSKSVRFHDDEKNGVTVCSLYDRWNDRTFVAKTRVHDVDQYDKAKGRAIAFNKARRKELLADIANLNEERTYVTRRYEAIMNRIDKNEGLKRIYLAGVEDELKDLMGYTDQTEADEPVDLCDGKALQNEEPNIKDVKLKQFAKLNTKL